MGDTYTYQPLPPVSGRQPPEPFTRLLCLYPATPGTNAIQCSLHLVSLEQGLQYEALSYTWGTEDPTRHLWLETGHSLAIRPNLETALLHLRLSTPRWLWVDAICIDQTNIDERSRQVAYMREVYRLASNVIVWIGLKFPGIELAFEATRQLAQSRAYDAAQHKLFSGNSTGLSYFKQAITAVSPEVMQKLYELSSRTYFTRCWCIQEVAMSQSCILKSEELEIPFMDFASLFHVINKTMGEPSPNPIWYLWWIVWDSKQPKPARGPSNVPGSLGSLIDVLEATRPVQATDNRDKLYAVLGLCDEGIKFLRGEDLGTDFAFRRPKVLEPNYRKDVVQVYEDLTRYMIGRAPGSLEVLGHVSHTSDPADSEFPSWVPKWFEPPSCSSMGTNFVAGVSQGLSTYWKGADPELEVKNPGVLSRDGFKVDVVESVSDVMMLDALDLDLSLSVFEKAWSSLFPFPIVPSSGQEYDTGIPLEVAFCDVFSAHPLGLITSSAMFETMSSGDVGLPNQITQSFKSVWTSAGSQGRSFIGLLNKRHELRMRGQEMEQGDVSRMATFLMGARPFANRRRMFRTRQGILGLGPQVMKPGDEIVLLFGGLLPYVLRPKGSHYIFLGESHIYENDVMDGVYAEQVLRDRNLTGLERVTFHLR